MPDTAPGRTRRRWLPELLTDPPFRRYWLAQTVSLCGDQVTALALPLLAVLTVDAGPAEMGYLTAVELAPNLLLALAAGAWIDRLRAKRRVMIVSDLARAAIVVAVPLAAWGHLLNMSWLYVVAFGVGTFGVLFEVSHTTLFVSLVPTTAYVQANALLNGSRAMSFVAGPSLAGLLVQVLTAPIALLVDVVSYLASAAFLTRIHPVEPPRAGDRGLAVIAEGLRFVFRSVVMRVLLLATTTLNLFNYMFWALFVLYATRELGVPAGVLGVVLGAAAFGGLLGAAVTGRLTRRFGVGPTLVAGFVLFPAPLLLVPLAGGPLPMIAGMLFAAEFLSALGVMMLDITVGSVQTALTPTGMLARVAGAKRTVNYGIRPVGALLGGALGAALGVLPALWVGAVGALTGTLWLLRPEILRMWTLPDRADPDRADPDRPGPDRAERAGTV